MSEERLVKGTGELEPKEQQLDERRVSMSGVA